MGNTSGKPHQKDRSKKYLLLKGAERPSRPGKPFLSEIDDNAQDSLTIYWEPPHVHGGTQLTGYIVEHKRTGAPNWTRSSKYKVHDAQLTLSGLEPGWRYQFRVFAENLIGLSDASELSDPLTVVTQHKLPALPPKFIKELQDTTTLENDKVEFVVHFVGQPAPKLCWFKDDFEIFSSRRTRILTELDRSVLTIHQSAISDEGEIKCTATNKLGHVSSRAKLTLEAPPSIRLPRQYEDGLLFEINELVRLKVSVAGRPRPLVFWSHDTESINESERHIIENDGNSSTLRINQVLRSDRGEYQIKAVNNLGIDAASFLVTVTDKPSPPGRAKVVMTLGRSVTLSWNLPQDDGGCKIGSYIVEYYRLGWNVWLKAATTKQLSTILGDLIEGSEYKFRVKAESPFGVSEPSEETEMVFIPDPKRGMLEPRGRSQPRDIIDELIPVAAKRKKSRSQSSPRTGHDDYEIDSPRRPKTPPEFSPKPTRKEISIDKAIFDRESIYKDLSYGSPDIKVKRNDIPSQKIDRFEKVELKSYGIEAVKESIRIPLEQLIGQSPSPCPSPNHMSVDSRERSPSPNPYIQSSDSNKFIKDKSAASTKKVLSRDNSDNLGGSTEFMMVLYPDESKIGSTMISFDEDLSCVPPPLSFSAPELGSDPPQLYNPIKYSASSTELLHERAMVRFYEEALAEEAAIKRKLERQENEGRRASAIPKIQINEQDIAHLERKHSLRRRRSAAGTVPQNIINTQKRHSLRSTGDFSDIFDSTSGKHALTLEERREIMKNRQRSHSEEKEEEEFDKIRIQMAAKRTEPKKKINILAEDIWEDEEYIESLSEGESSEAETYHPSMRILSKAQPKDAAFEILNKPAKLREPDFVPKPILKKNNGDTCPTTSGSEMDATRSRSNSLIEEYLEIQKPKTDEMKSNVEVRKTSAIAGAGLTAAGIIISHPILTQTEAEESKSVIQHYGEIVKTQSNRSVRLDDNPIRAALRQQARMQAAMHFSDEEQDQPEPPPDPVKRMDPPLITSPPKLKKDPIVSKPIVDVKTMEVFVKMQTPPMKPSEPLQKTQPRGREASRFRKRSTSQSKSPSRLPDGSTTDVKTVVETPKRSASRTKATTNTSRPSSRSNSRPPSRSSSQAHSGSRSGSVVRTTKRSASKSRSDRRSSSPAMNLLRKPKMCEIMTQTSVSMDTAVASTSTGTVLSLTRDDSMMKAKVRVKVRNTMDYITDLAMFAVVLWVFLFSNELLAIPFLLVAVFRQLQDEIQRWIPQWILRKWQNGKKE